MSVLCCRVPNFLISLACCQQPALAQRPLALVGPDDRICAASALARGQGVRAAMSGRQARTHCPELVLQAVEKTNFQQAQAAFLGTLAECGLPVEALDWGAAYIDLHSVATQVAPVQALIAELGRQVRTALGPALQPALGWDAGKFTARAAAIQTPAGKMRLVSKADEAPFLAPLPLTLLPLPATAIQALHWLGVSTLGQFAALPTVGIRQRFGHSGWLAQRWAQGRDDRPVRATAQTLPAALVIDLDPPAVGIPAVLAAAMAGLHPHLQALQARMEGYRQLRLAAHFLDGSERSIDMAWVEPCQQPDPVQQALATHLRRLNWPNALVRLRISVLETGELRPQQLTLFGGEPTRPPALAELARQLATRFGPVFLGVEFTDPMHPIPTRRFRLHSLG